MESGCVQFNSLGPSHPLGRGESACWKRRGRALLARLCSGKIAVCSIARTPGFVREHCAAGKSLTRASSDRGTYMGAPQGPRCHTRHTSPHKALRLFGPLSSQGKTWIVHSSFVILPHRKGWSGRVGVGRCGRACRCTRAHARARRRTLRRRAPGRRATPACRPARAPQAAAPRPPRPPRPPPQPRPLPLRALRRA